MAVERLNDQARVLTTYKQVHEACAYYLKKPLPLALDTETTGLNPRTCKLVAVQLYQEGDPYAAIIDWRRIDTTLVVPALNRLLRDKVVVGHNLKFDINFLHAAGVYVHKPYDTELAERIIIGMGAQEGATFHLKDVVHRRLMVPMSKTEREWFYKPAPLDQRPEEWAAPFPEEEVAYMALDVTVLPAIKSQQETPLREAKLQQTFDLEMRVLPALAAMERAGIRIEVDGWRAFIEEKAKQAEGLQAQLLTRLALPILQARLKDYDEKRAVVETYEALKAREEARLREDWERLTADWGAAPGDEGEPPKWGEYKKHWMAVWHEEGKHARPPSPKQDATLPNINSTDQLLDGLQGLGIEVGSTKSATLQQFEHEPVVALLLKYRKAEKFVTSFGESLLEKVQADGRIHPEYRQIGAATGRMACTNPNWQQVPSRGDGKRLRGLVVPADGHRLVVADFSNIELRILADVSGDKALIEMFESGLDLHSEMAYKLFGLDRSVDVKEATVPGSGWTYRDTAKTLNYGLVYGMSPVRLARMLRVDKEKAQEIFDAYFEVLPGVRRWLDQQKRKGITDLRVYTSGGRWRRFPAWSQDGKMSRSQWKGRVERQAGNSPIQGTSADITKLAVALFYEGHASDHATLVAVVHDELVVECPATEAEQVARRLETCMDDAQREYIKLSPAALPRPEAKVSDHWEH
jgi:DNA polymerase-1